MEQHHARTRRAILSSRLRLGSFGSQDRRRNVLLPMHPQTASQAAAEQRDTPNVTAEASLGYVAEREVEKKRKTQHRSSSYAIQRRCMQQVEAAGGFSSVVKWEIVELSLLKKAGEPPR